MKISSDFFEAFLKCPTKCWLRFTGEPTAGNAYAEWVQAQNESYRADAAKRLMADVPPNECDVAPLVENLKTAKWRVAVDMPARIELGSRGNEGQPSPPENSQSLLMSAATIETCLHAIERIPSAGQGQPAQFVPIRFIHRNKHTKDDKLLLAFDAFVLSEMLGRAVSLGKIIHGDDHATLKVKTSALAGEVRKRLGKITALPASPAPPDLVLNRHCTECEFQARCRKLAVERDDLSLLASMSAKERQKLRSKGIQTYRCWKCRSIFGVEKRFSVFRKYGWNLAAYLFYNIVELNIPQRTAVESFNRLFDFNLPKQTLNHMKMRFGRYYEETRQKILENIVRGRLVHADETRANIKGKTGFVWVLTNMNEVYYTLADSREGDMVQKLLPDFKGVLVSDFYTAYDSIGCPQQRCLIHLMRDLNDEILNNPFDDQLKKIITALNQPVSCNHFRKLGLILFGREPLNVKNKTSVLASCGGSITNLGMQFPRTFKFCSFRHN